MDDGLRVLVLGPVVIAAGESELPVRRPLERGLLVRLALARGVGVPDGTLAADLWHADGEEGSLTARLRVVASRLRRALGPYACALVRSGGGYRIDAEVPDLRAVGAAAERLHAAVRAGRHDAVPAAAADALGPWRGPALADLRGFPFARAEGERLDAWRLELTVHRLTAEVALGAGSELVAELAELSGRNPLHEPLRGMLALALYRAGRQADALAALADLRRSLADELGVVPTADTADLELRLLRHAPGLRPTVLRTVVVAPRALPAATDVGPVIARGLVGRRAELSRLAGRLDAALASEPGVVVVEGGPGTGRTRMLEAVAQLGEQHGILACWGRATAAGGAPPFWPWRQALRQWKQRTDPATAGPVLARSGGPLATIIPGFGPESSRGQAAPDPDDRFGLFEHVVAFLADAASSGPGLLVLLDDLHLADLASLLLLGHLSRGETACRLMIVASVRPGELRPDQTAALADVRRQQATSRMELGGLAASEVAEQLALVLDRPCAPDVAADVALRTGGNPLFVQEIGRMMAAGGSGLPTGIRDTVRRQLDALPARCRAVLAAAAVLAGDVEADVVAAAVTRPADHPIDEVLDRLDEAVAAGFLLRGERPDRYRFAHDVARDVVRLDTGSAERARIHLRAAEHLESTGAEAARIAHHRLEALPVGDRARAVHAARAAADLALRQLAFEDATRLYDRAIDAGAALDLPARAELLLGRARTRYLSHDVSAAMRSCEDAAALAEHLDDPVLLGRAATVLLDLGDPAWLALSGRWCRRALAALPEDDSPLRAQLLAHLAGTAIWATDGSDPAEADAIGEAALLMAERLGDSTAALAALRARQLARSGPDGTHDRLECGTRMLGLARGAGDSAELWGRLWRFDALVQLGRADEADDELDRLEPVVARMRQPMARWHLVRSRAALLNARGRFAEARAAADEAVAVSQRGHHQAAEYPSHAVRLHIGLLAGDPPDPVVFEVERYHPPPRILSTMAALWHATHGELDQAERIHARLPRPEPAAVKPFMHLMFHAVSGTLAAALGDEPAAEYAYAQLAPHAALHVTVGAGVSTTGGSVHLPLGTIAAALGRTDAAVDHLRAAVTANAAAGLTPYAAIAGIRLAEQLRRRSQPGDVEEAAVVAADATAAAERLGMPLR